MDGRTKMSLFFKNKHTTICIFSYRSEKKLLKHIGDVHGMQKQLRAQYRMVNVSKVCKIEFYYRSYSISNGCKFVRYSS